MRKAYRILDKASDLLVGAALGAVVTAAAGTIFLRATQGHQWLHDSGVLDVLVLPALLLCLLATCCCVACVAMLVKSDGDVLDPSPELAYMEGFVRGMKASSESAYLQGLRRGVEASLHTCLRPRGARAPIDPKS